MGKYAAGGLQNDVQRRYSIAVRSQVDGLPLAGQQQLSPAQRASTALRTLLTTGKDTLFRAAHDFTAVARRTDLDNVSDLLALYRTGAELDRAARIRSAELALRRSVPLNVVSRKVRDYVVEAVDGLDLWVSPSEDKDGLKREYDIKIELRLRVAGEVLSFRRGLMVESDSTTYNPLEDDRVMTEVCKAIALNETEWLSLAMLIDTEDS